MYSYKNTRRVAYEGGATFIPVCENCGRYVKADPAVWVSEAKGLSDKPNAMCKRCGRTRMLFEGFY